MSQTSVLGTEFTFRHMLPKHTRMKGSRRTRFITVSIHSSGSSSKKGAVMEQSDAAVKGSKSVMLQSVVFKNIGGGERSQCMQDKCSSTMCC